MYFLQVKSLNTKKKAKNYLYDKTSLQQTPVSRKNSISIYQITLKNVRHSQIFTIIFLNGICCNNNFTINTYKIYT